LKSASYIAEVLTSDAKKAVLHIYDKSHAVKYAGCQLPVEMRMGNFKPFAFPALSQSKRIG
jgi:hypothetical protein